MKSTVLIMYIKIPYTPFTIFLHIFYWICFFKVAEFMAEADVDQNGKLDYDEFSRMLLREPTFDN